jgi:hypothetical protein
VELIREDADRPEWIDLHLSGPTARYADKKKDCKNAVEVRHGYEAMGGVCHPVSAFSAAGALLRPAPT